MKFQNFQFQLRPNKFCLRFTLLMYFLIYLFPCMVNVSVNSFQSCWSVFEVTRRIKCTRTHHSASDEARTSDPLISIRALPASHCAHQFLSYKRHFEEAFFFSRMFSHELFSFKNCISCFCRFICSVYTFTS